MLLIIALPILVSLSGQGPERVLDLTRPAEPANSSIPPLNMQNCRLMGRGAGQSGGTPPFALAIQGFDKPDYSMGEAIVVDLKLTNTSQNSVSIPTVLADQFLDPFEGEEAIQFGFTIYLKDENGEDQALTATMLRGSAKFRDTTELLAPGESIRIHFPGYIPINDGASVPTREGQLFASLLISDGECRMWNVVRSKAVGKARFRGR